LNIYIKNALVTKGLILPI